MKPPLLILSLLLLGGSTTTASEPIRFDSTTNRVTILELFTSQGCSSCPPAELWLSKFKTDPRLWREIVPIAFHVDYWDRLGWKDPFATRANTARQYQYARVWKGQSVYTPGFSLNGREWKGWYQGRKEPFSAPQSTGRLVAELQGRKLTASYSGPENNLELHIAMLGFGTVTRVGAGENRNRKLIEDFVCLASTNHVANNSRWTVPLPTCTPQNTTRKAIALWVSRRGHPEPLQATGGWLID